MDVFDEDDIEIIGSEDENEDVEIIGFEDDDGECEFLADDVVEEVIGASAPRKRSSAEKKRVTAHTPSPPAKRYVEKKECGGPKLKVVV